MSAAEVTIYWPTRLAEVLSRLVLLVLVGGLLALSLACMRDAREIQRDGQLVTQLLNFGSVPQERIRRTYAAVLARRGGATCAAEGELPAVVLTAWLAEEALAQGRTDEISALQAQAETVARRALICEPANAFAMTFLARARFLAEGANAALLPLLRLSREMAPREAWVILRRVPTAVALIREMSDRDRNWVAGDLVALVESGFVREAVDALLFAPRDFQAMVSARIGHLPAPFQSAFQRRAMAIGVAVSGLTIPVRWDPFK